MRPTVQRVASWWPRLLAATAMLVLAMALAPAQLAFAAHTDRDLTLGDEGKELGIRIGTAVAFTPMSTNPTYAQILGQQFTAITPENEMKWASIERTQGVLDFTQADAEVAFAKAHDQFIRGHNLVWHSQLPAWLTSGTFTPAQLTDILHQHITDEVKHFKGKLFQWDVVNEPFNEDGTFRKTIWFNAIGPSYIADALTWAHQADPHAKLYLNDFNIDGIGAKSNAMLALAQSLRAQDVPIDGIGIEGHLGLQFGFPNMYEANVKRFADAGFDVSVTESDNRMVLPVTPALLTLQAQNYARQLNGCIMVTRCVDFTVWEFTDKYSWVPGTFRNQGAADIYDENLMTKPAFDAMMAALVTPVSTARHHTGGDD